MNLFLTKTAQRELDEIKNENPRDYDNIISDIKDLQNKPFPRSPKGKKIYGKNGILWRLRSGDYRILYRPFARGSLIILRIILRKDLEHLLKHFS